MTSHRLQIPFPGLVETLQDVFLWWSAQMGTFCPDRRRAVAGIRLVISKAGFTLDGAPPRPVTELGEHLLALGLSKDMSKSSMTLILAEDRLLKRVISDRRLPFSRLRKAAELDVITQTPFALSEIKIVPSARQRDGASFYIVRVRLAEQIAEQLSAASMTVGALVLGAGERAETASPRAIGLPVRRSLPLDWIIGFITVLLWAMAFVQIEQKAAEASAALGVRIEAATKTAQTARREHDRHRAEIEKMRLLDARQTAATSIIAVWSELTRVIPDTAFLTDFTLQGGVAEIAGFAKQPAALIGAIEASPHFRQAGFTSPVVRVPGFEAEHFVLTFRSEGG